MRIEASLVLGLLGPILATRLLDRWLPKRWSFASGK